MSTVRLCEDFPRPVPVRRALARKLRKKAENEELIVAQLYRTLRQTAFFDGRFGKAVGWSAR